jgi:hypothetical protein
MPAKCGGGAGGGPGGLPRARKDVPITIVISETINTIAVFFIVISPSNVKVI